MNVRNDKRSKYAQKHTQKNEIHSLIYTLSKKKSNMKNTKHSKKITDDYNISSNKFSLDFNRDIVNAKQFA